MDSRGYQSTVIKSKDRAGFNMRENKLHRYVGQPMLRREDRRLLIGKGQYVGDIALRVCCTLRSFAARSHMRASSPSIFRVLRPLRALRSCSPARICGNNCHPALRSRCRSCRSSGARRFAMPSTIRRSPCWPSTRSALLVRRWPSSWQRPLRGRGRGRIGDRRSRTAAHRARRRGACVGCTAAYEQLGHNVNGSMEIAKATPTPPWRAPAPH